MGSVWLAKYALKLFSLIAFVLISTFRFCQQTFRVGWKSLVAANIVGQPTQGLRCAGQFLSTQKRKSGNSSQTTFYYECGPCFTKHLPRWRHFIKRCSLYHSFVEICSKNSTKNSQKQAKYNQGYRDSNLLTLIKDERFD